MHWVDRSNHSKPCRRLCWTAEFDKLLRLSMPNIDNGEVACWHLGKNLGCRCKDRLGYWASFYIVFVHKYMCVVHEHFGLTYGSRLIAMPLCRYMCNTHVLVSLVVVVAVAIVCTHVCPVSHQLCHRHVLKISLEAMYKDRTCHMCHTVLRSNLRSNADHVFGDLRSCLSI